MKKEQKCVISKKFKHLIFNFLREKKMKKKNRTKNVLFPKKSKHLIIIFYVLKEYTILMNKTLFWNAFLRLKKKVYCVLFSATFLYPSDLKIPKLCLFDFTRRRPFQRDHTLLVFV